jgi:hypothetical protein
MVVALSKTQFVLFNGHLWIESASINGFQNARTRAEYRTSEVTGRLTTNIETVRRFVDRMIEVDGVERKPGTVTLTMQVK